MTIRRNDPATVIPHAAERGKQRLSMILTPELENKIITAIRGGLTTPIPSRRRGSKTVHFYERRNASGRVKGCGYFVIYDKRQKAIISFYPKGWKQHWLEGSNDE